MHVLLGDLTGKSVLEFGCGNGLMYESFGFDKANYLGVDFSDGLLKKFKESYPTANLLKAQAEDFLIHQKFDLIFSCGLVQYLSPPLLNKHLSHIRKMLKDSGRVILACIPWKTAKLSFIRNDHGDGLSISRILQGCFNSFSRETVKFGYWYDMRTLKKLAKKNGFNCTIYGSLHYHYRQHVMLSLPQ